MFEHQMFPHLGITMTSRRATLHPGRLVSCAMVTGRMVMIAVQRGWRKLLSAYTPNGTMPWLVCIACVVGVVSISACRPAGQGYRVVVSDFMEFEDLFTPIDTVRLDASVLIGSITFLDKSDQGQILVTDREARAIHVFSSSGRHLRMLEITQCNPEDTGRLLSTRFLKNGSMIATTTQGVYVLNANGSCQRRLLELPPNRPSFCERQDTVYLLNPRVRPLPQLHAYSIESGGVRVYDLRKPRFPRTTALRGGSEGRGIACFDRGVFYRYAESSDGEPLWPGNDLVLHQPKSYRPPERDITSQGMGDIISDLLQLEREFTYSSGIYELDENHRMIMTRSGYPAEFNLNIVNMDTETSVSAVLDPEVGISAAKDGLVYSTGDYEILPSGETGNRMLEVRQFHPFE